MIRNLEVNESKITDLNQRKRQMSRDARIERQKQARKRSVGLQNREKPLL